MDPKELIARLDDARIVEAIQRAESQSRGEIRVHVTSEAVGDPENAARLTFARLGMSATAERNGVLIYVSPRAQTFAIIGDEGVHRHCGESFWKGVAEAMTEDFRAHRYTEGVVRAIEHAGKVLARHFPRVEDRLDRDELSNEISRD